MAHFTNERCRADFLLKDMAHVEKKTVITETKQVPDVVEETTVIQQPPQTVVQQPAVIQQPVVQRPTVVNTPVERETTVSEEISELADGDGLV
jgi:hypothetical protein